MTAKEIFHAAPFCVWLIICQVLLVRSLVVVLQDSHNFKWTPLTTAGWWLEYNNAQSKIRHFIIKVAISDDDRLTFLIATTCPQAANDSCLRLRRLLTPYCAQSASIYSTMFLGGILPDQHFLSHLSLALCRFRRVCGKADISCCLIRFEHLFL